MDIRQWIVLRLLCALLVHSQLSVAAAEGVIFMLHGSNVQTVCTGAVLKSVAGCKTQLNLALMLWPSRA